MRHPSLTISCKAGVIVGERRARGLGTARNKTSSERPAYKMDSSGFGESASVWAALVLRRVSYVFALPDSENVRTLSMTRSEIRRGAFGNGPRVFSKIKGKEETAYVFFHNFF